MMAFFLKNVFEIVFDLINSFKISFYLTIPSLKNAGKHSAPDLLDHPAFTNRKVLVLENSLVVKKGFARFISLEHSSEIPHQNFSVPHPEVEISRLRKTNNDTNP